MLFLIFSVLASVSVSLLLKFARARSLSIEQMVACNYWVAIALTLLFLQPDIAQRVCGHGPCRGQRRHH